MGIFSTGPDIAPDVQFAWSIGSGSTVNRDTGPPFDHTSFNPSGKYMYLKSQDQGQGDKAWLVSESFNMAQECRMTFFYHMKGTDVGALRVLIL